MKKYVKEESKYTATEYSLTSNVIKYFYLYCDICGLKYGTKEIIVID